MKKNAFRYLMTYLTAILTAVLNFAYTPQVKADDGFYLEIVFKNNTQSGGGASSTVYSTSPDPSDVLESGTEYVQSITTNTAYSSADGMGIKLGSSKASGSITLNLKNEYATKVDSIIFTAARFNTKTSVDVTFNGTVVKPTGTVLETFKYTSTEVVSQISISATKYANVKSIKIYPVPPTPTGSHILHLNLNGADVSELSSFWSNGVTKTDSIFNDNSTTAITLPDISSARDGYTGHWETASQAAPTTGDGTTITSVTPGTEDIYVVAVWTAQGINANFGALNGKATVSHNGIAIADLTTSVTIPAGETITVVMTPVTGKFYILDIPGTDVTYTGNNTFTFPMPGTALTVTAPREYAVTDFYALKYQAAAGVLTTSGSIDLTGKTLVVLDGKKLCLQDNSAGLVVELGTAASEGMLRKTLTAGTVEGTFAKVGDYIHLTSATIGTALTGDDVTLTPVTTIDPLYTEGSFVQVSGTINNWIIGNYKIYPTNAFNTAFFALEKPELTDNFDVTGALYYYQSGNIFNVYVSSAADFHTAVPAGTPTLTSNANPVNQVTITPANKCHAFYAVVAKDAAQPAAADYTEITAEKTVAITADEDVWTYGARDFYPNSTAVKTAYQYKTAQSFTITVSELGVTRDVACKENENILDKVDEPTNTPFGLTFEYYVNGSDLTTAAKIGATDKPSGAMTIYAVYSYEDAIQKETAFIPAEADDLEDGLTGLIVYDNKCFDGSKTTDIGTANHVDNIQFDADVIYPSQNSTLDLLNRTVTFETCGNGYAVKTKSGVYFNHTGTGAGLESSQTPCEASVQITSGNLSLKIGTFSLRYNNQGAGFFRFYGSGQQDVSFYSQVEVPATVRTLAGDVHTLSYTDTKLSVSIDKDVVPSGSLVQANVLVDVEVTPESGMQVDKLTVNGTDVAFDEKNDCYSFPMPAADATIAVTYKSGTPTAVEDVDAPGAATVVKKVFIDGKVYIVRDGVYYDMNGVRIN